MLTTQREQREAYNDAVRINKITKPILLNLHKIENHALDHWRYVEGRSIPFIALYQLRRYIKNNGLELPRKLKRIFKVEDAHIKSASENEPKAKATKKQLIKTTRNRQILESLATKSVKSVAVEFCVSIPTVYRIKKNGE